MQIKTRLFTFFERVKIGEIFWFVSSEETPDKLPHRLCYEKIDEKRGRIIAVDKGVSPAQCSKHRSFDATTPVEVFGSDRLK
ncbi:MAG: hypothetical protein WCK48_00540 [bacterium]